MKKALIHEKHEMHENILLKFCDCRQRMVIELLHLFNLLILFVSFVVFVDEKRFLG